MRFVQKDEERVAVQCPCKGNPLPLSCRQSNSAFTYRGVVSVRKPQNHLVGASSSCRFEYGLFVEVLFHSSYVLGYRTIEELCGLCCKADMTSQRPAIPLLQRSPVNAHGAARWRPEAGQ